jgi:hypothetical protein
MKLEITMHNLNEQKPRLVFLLGLVGSVLMLTINHIEVLMNREHWIAVTMFGPPFLCLSAAGVFDPRIPIAIGKHGAHLPVWMKVTATVLSLLGLAGSALLMYLYR